MVPRKRPRQWPPLLISYPCDSGVERERLIGGKGRRNGDIVWCDREQSDKFICAGCWEEEGVLKGCNNRNRFEAGKSDNLMIGWLIDKRQIRVLDKPS